MKLLEFFQFHLEFLPVFVKVFHKLGDFSLSLLILYLETMLKFGMQLKEQQLFDIHLPKNQVFQICLSFLKKSLSFWPKFSLSFLHFSLSIFFAERKKKPGLEVNLTGSGGFQRRSKLICPHNSTVRFCDIWKNPYSSYQLANLDDPKAQNYVF